MHVGQGAAQGFDRAVELLGEFERVGIGLLGNGDEYGRHAPLRSDTELRRTAADHHVGNVAYRNGGAVGGELHHAGSQQGGVAHRQHTAHDVFVSVFIEHAARSVDVHVAHGGFHFGERYAVMPHASGCKTYLILFDVAADDRNLRHARRREQTGTDGAVGNAAQLLQRAAVGGQSDNHHFAEYRRLRTQHRLSDRGRQRLADSRQFFGNDLTRFIDVCFPIEFDPYDRKAVRRRRAHPTHAGGSVESCFDMEGYRVFDLLRRHTGRLRHDHHRRSVEVGKDVDFHLPRRVGTRAGKEYRQNDNQQPVVQRIVYNFVEHGGRINGCANVRAVSRPMPQPFSPARRRALPRVRPPASRSR